ncbi:MAG: RNA polymerase sigma-70 factor [Saprospiraceae bacterium]
MHKISQEDVMTRLKHSDDKLALKELFQAYHGYVCATIYKIIKEQNTVEDLAQEVFLRFWQKRDQITISTSVQAYLRRMAINEALGHLRKKKVFEEEINNETMGGSTSGGEGQYLHGELKDQVRAAVDQLPSRCRTVFQLSRYEEMSYKEIAVEMDISVKTVENQMGKALKFLRKELKNYLHFLLIINIGVMLL